VLRCAVPKVFLPPTPVNYSRWQEEEEEEEESCEQSWWLS